jgi:hypothetical protein
MAQDLITLSIGELATAFWFVQFGESEAVAKHYRSFMVASTDAPAWRLQVSVAPEMISVEGFSFQPVRIERERTNLKILRPDFQANVNLTTKRGTLLYAGDLPSLDTFLRALYSVRLLEVEGLLVHASSVEYQGLGYLFVGKSGAGKSTVAQLSGARILTDEISLVRQKRGKFFIYGTPFWGELRGGGEPVCVPLRSLNFLHKDRSTFTCDLRVAAAARSLLQCTLFFGSQREWRERLLEIAERICLTIDCQDLHFGRDREFLELIDAGKTVKNQ